jgi:hypothetical protein
VVFVNFATLFVASAGSLTTAMPKVPKSTMPKLVSAKLMQGAAVQAPVLPLAAGVMTVPGVVPPPPQAESKAAAAMAQAESWIGNDRMKVSLGL